MNCHENHENKGEEEVLQSQESIVMLNNNQGNMIEMGGGMNDGKDERELFSGIQFNLAS